MPKILSYHGTIQVIGRRVLDMDPMYLNDIESCYIGSFEASVIDTGSAEGDFVVLDRTAFYPLGGGQNCDTGRLEWDSGSSIVVDVRKKDRILHFLKDPLPPVGTKVKAHIDWENRLANMRMHTAQHMVSAIVWKRYKARTVGNQIYPDRSRIDFSPLKLGEDDLALIAQEANRLISEGHPVLMDFRDRSFFEGSEDSERLDIGRVPKDITTLRTISIGKGGSVDVCPCAGTHVRSLSELGHLRIIGSESKGRDRVRLEYTLEPYKG